ncbi:hypothetical protein Barb4_04889 [Bacteroidales bacterium Barb4]|nr:hypothetical protein Barb4_04889 [Bacteroidales bacterium Barb4]
MALLNISITFLISENPSLASVSSVPLTLPPLLKNSFANSSADMPDEMADAL